MKYLVTATGGPGYESREEAVHILKEIVLPSFDHLIKLEKDGKILGGGLPVGDRAFTFVLEAASNDEVDRVLRAIPIWPMMDWDVVALQGFETRAAMEREVAK